MHNLCTDCWNGIMQKRKEREVVVDEKGLLNYRRNLYECDTCKKRKFMGQSISKAAYTFKVVNGIPAWKEEKR